MELKYTEVDTVINGETFGDNTVSMLLFGMIDGNNQNSINSKQFIEEMNFYNGIGKQVLIKINSPGGEVFGGFAIMEAIEDNQADTYVVGLAASISGVILQAGKRRFANRRATFMAHAPKGGTSNASKAMVNMVRESLQKELTAKSNLDEQEITDLMDSKEALFFNADEMESKGLVDKIIKSGQMLDTQILNKSTDEIYMAYNGLLNKPNPIKMEKVMNHLGLDNKTEDDVLNVVKELELKAAKVDELETSVTNLTEEIKTLKEASELELTNKATELIVNAIKDGKIKEDQKEDWIEQATNNFDLANSTLGSLSTKKATSVTSIIDKGGDSEKSYEYLAINEPEVLNTMAEEEPEKFDALVKAHELKINNKI